MTLSTLCGMNLKHPLCVGDYDPFALAKHLTKKEFSFAEILNSEKGQEFFSSLYGHNLRHGAKILRSATRFASTSWLQKEGLAEKLEICMNLAISQAKLAIQNSQTDALLAGVLGPSAQPDFTLKELEEEFAQSLIFMADFGVECLVLEGFSDFSSLKTAVETACRLTNLPIAVFFSIPSKAVKKEVEAFFHLAEKNQLEMVGFCCSFENYEKWSKAISGVMGWMVASLPPKKQWEKIFHALSHSSTWGMMGSGFVPYPLWVEWQREIRPYQQKARLEFSTQKI